MPSVQFTYQETKNQGVSDPYMFIKPDDGGLDIPNYEVIGDDQGTKMFSSNVLQNLGEFHDGRNKYSA